MKKKYIRNTKLDYAKKELLDGNIDSNEEQRCSQDIAAKWKRSNLKNIYIGTPNHPHTHMTYSQYYTAHSSHSYGHLNLPRFQIKCFNSFAFASLLVYSFIHFVRSFVNFSTNWFYEFEIRWILYMYYGTRNTPLVPFHFGMIYSMMSKSNEYFIHLSQLIDDQFTSESLNQCCCQIRRNSQRHYQSSSCLFMCLWIVIVNIIINQYWMWIHVIMSLVAEA